MPYRADLSLAAPPPAALVAVVTARWPECAGQDWRALPGGRVNRLWQVGDIVIKAYDPQGASPLFPNDPMAEAAALTHLAGTGLAPDLVDQGPGWLAYKHVTGPLWQRDTALAARLLAKLHAVPLPKATTFRCLPDLRKQAETMATQCKGPLPPMPVCPDYAPVAPAFLHGDPVPGNIIIGPDGPLLIDWQCPCIGDPVQDIALFLSPAMQMLYRGSPLTALETEQFLGAYPDPKATARYCALAPLFHWRMLAHCQWRAERGDRDYAAAMNVERAAL